jgi:2-aminobenzoate-CoA ligase
MTPSAHLDTFARDRLPPAAEQPEFLFELPALQFAERLNCAAELLDQRIAQGWGQRRCLIASDGTLWTYADLQAQANRIANVLVHDMGLLPGNRVLLRGGNTIGMALAWLGVVHAGLVAVTTMPLLRAKEIAEVIHKAKPVLALCDGKLLAELELAQAQQPQLKALITFNQPDNTAGLEALAAAKNGMAAACPTSADDIAILAFTSGTTGSPKAAVHTHRD